ncbi:hypothetical protein [Tropicimonas isoalkanivorans]|uniref:Lipoprotein n=1 Tax=Tropicimonas isoalkanivorans TaxID=441112 RepID=A0A1I1PCE5_9RHOB|nr:hypothetical protein [Tropicimonas isoalkanivorans]SFD07574.1 hypothetical protein SAMN04488094_114128 [Tropicimonas isoalkanivorans]
MYRIGRLLSCGGAIALASLSACTGPTDSADFWELNAMRPGHVFPQSSPATFVNTFDQFCVEGPDSLRAMDVLLRRSGYVPLRSNWGEGGRTYVVDDMRPAIMVSGTSCAAVAGSRTGQTDRARRYIGTRFPGAEPVREEMDTEGAREIWLVGTNPPDMIGTARHVGPVPGSRFVILRQREGLFAGP